MRNRIQQAYWILAAVIVMTPAAAFALTEPDRTESLAPPAFGGNELASLGLSLLIVLGVIVVLGWLYSRTRFTGNGGSSLISVIASRALGPRERLLLVEVADQQLLVGMTATQLQTLHVFEKHISVGDEPSVSTGFKDRLRAAFGEAGK
jgi:flagellar protein FliO/FliZ